MGKVIKLKLRRETGEGGASRCHIVESKVVSYEGGDYVMVPMPITLEVRRMGCAGWSWNLLLGRNCAFAEGYWAVGGDLKGLKRANPRLYRRLKDNGLLFNSSRGARK